MRKMWLLLCVALGTVCLAEDAVSQTNPYREDQSSTRVARLNPLRPARRLEQPPRSEAAPEKHSTEWVTQSLPRPWPVETKRVVETPQKAPKPIVRIREIRKTYFFERLPSIDITADPPVPPSAFDEIDLVTRGILTPDVSALVPDYLAEMTKQPQRSLFESISNEAILENRVAVRVDLHQLLAGTIKHNTNLTASNYRIVEPETWFGESMQRFDWEAFPETRPLDGVDDDSSAATYRISLNYSQQANSFNEENNSKRPIVRVDVRSPDLQVVQSLLRQLEAVANEYWSVVAERGKLVAATDQLNSCQQVLSLVDKYRDDIPQDVLALALTGCDRSAKVRNEALVRLEAAQLRLANLVGDPMLQNRVEIMPQELPSGVTMLAMDQEVAIANKNRADAKTSPEGVAMDVTLAHQRLGYALVEANRSFEAIHNVKTNFGAEVNKDSPIHKLTTALELQDQLRESTTQFLDDIVEQQRSLIDLKRAKGTLARTEVFPATGRLPQILTPAQLGDEQLSIASPNGTQPMTPPPAIWGGEGGASAPPISSSELPAEIARQIPGEITHIDGHPVEAMRPSESRFVEQPRPIASAALANPEPPRPEKTAPRPSRWSAAKRWLSKLTENQPIQLPKRR